MAVLGNMNAVLKDLTLIVEDEIKQTQQDLHPLICSVIPEEGAYTRVPVAANMPMMSKFEGERSSKGKDVTVVQTYTQDTYELTIDIDSDLLRNAKAYTYSGLVREATMSAKLYPSWVASNAVINGSTSGYNGYDGIVFYPVYGASTTTAHHYAGVTSGPDIVNSVQSTGVSVTELQADLTSAMTKIRTFQDNAKRLLNPYACQGPNQLLIHCPAALEQKFRQVVHAGTIPMPITSTSTTIVAGAGVENVGWKGTADIYPDGYLDATSASVWYLHYVGMPQKPFVFLENYGLMVDVLGYGSEFEINTKRVRIALKRRFVLGYYRFDRSIRIY